MPRKRNPKLMADEMDNFSFSSDEALDALQALRNGKGFDRSVCTCGHPSMHHQRSTDRDMCLYMNMYCPCGQVNPVIEVEDFRYFQKATHGEGSKHALALGITSSRSSKKWVKWLIKPICMKCKDESQPMRPVPLTQNGQRTVSLGFLNVLACHNCLP